MFRFEKPAEKLVMFGFSHGRLMDAWSVVHLGSGILLGCVAVYFDWSAAFSLSFLMLLMFLYELWEAYMDIVEDVENAIGDILIGAIGVAAVLIADKMYSFSDSGVFTLFAVVSALNLLLLYIGYKTYLADRMKKKKYALQPEWGTKAGFRQNTLDHLYFFGFGAAFIPLPLLITEYGSGIALAIFFGVAGVFALARKALSVSWAKQPKDLHKN